MMGYFSEMDIERSCLSNDHSYTAPVFLLREKSKNSKAGCAGMGVNLWIMKTLRISAMVILPRIRLMNIFHPSLLDIEQTH